MSSFPCIPKTPWSVFIRGTEFHCLRPPVLGKALSFHQHNHKNDKANGNRLFLRASSGIPGLWRVASCRRGRALGREFPPGSASVLSWQSIAGWGSTNVTRVCTHLYLLCCETSRWVCAAGKAHSKTRQSTEKHSKNTAKHSKTQQCRFTH